MSIKVMTAVLEKYPAGGNELLLALVLADFANDGGEGIWPSVATLARKTRTSRRTVQGLLRRLEKIGFLAVVRRSAGGKSNEWRILLGFFDDCAKFAPSLKPRKTKQVNCATDGATPRKSPAPKPPPSAPYPPPPTPSGGEELLWPILAIEERAAIAEMVASLAVEEAQQILDEVAGNIQAGTIRRSASALARELVKRTKAGTFRPDLGGAVAGARTVRAVAAAEKAAEDKKWETQPDPQKKAENVEKAKAALKRKEFGKE